jgi:hypothetical protein
MPVGLKVSGFAGHSAGCAKSNFHITSQPSLTFNHTCVLVAGRLFVCVLTCRLGMTHTWDVWGQRIPLTAIQLQDNQVVEQRTKAVHGVDAVRCDIAASWSGLVY